MEVDLRNAQYNQSRINTGDSLRTLRGSIVERYKGRVGKYIGNKLYFHKQYVDEVLDEEQLKMFYEMDSKVPFEYNCVRLLIRENKLALIEAPDFDTAREPVVGRIFYQASEEADNRISRFYNNIWHHKWLWVKDDYEGFDVKESWEWSRKWLSVLDTMADGSNETNWKNQLEKYNLK